MYARVTVSSGKKSLADLRAEAEAVGALVSPEEVNPKPVPDDQNAALIYRRMIDHKRPDDEFTWHWEHWTRMPAMQKPAVNVQAVHDLPLCGDIEEFLAMAGCDIGFRVGSPATHVGREPKGAQHMSRILLVAADRCLSIGDAESFAQYMRAALRCGRDMNDACPSMAGPVCHAAITRWTYAAALRMARCAESPKSVQLVLDELGDPQDYQVQRMICAEMAMGLWYLESPRSGHRQDLRAWNSHWLVPYLRHMESARTLWAEATFEWLIFIKGILNTSGESTHALREATLEWLNQPRPYIQRVNLPVGRSGVVSALDATTLAESHRRATLAILELLRDFDGTWEDHPTMPIDPITGDRMHFSIHGGRARITWKFTPYMESDLGGQSTIYFVEAEPPQFSGKRESSGTL